jgi:hypothetical protein
MYQYFKQDGGSIEMSRPGVQDRKGVAHDAKPLE